MGPGLHRRAEWNEIEQPSTLDRRKHPRIVLEILPVTIEVHRNGWRGRIRTFNPLIQSCVEPFAFAFGRVPSPSTNVHF
jgi:hypothetical protein